MIDEATAVVMEPKFQCTYFALYRLPNNNFCLSAELALKGDLISLLPGYVTGNFGDKPLNVVMGQDPRTAKSLAKGYRGFAGKLEKELERVPTEFANARKILDITRRVSTECARVFAEERQITAESFSKAQQMSYN
jgi:hypothetical protein